MSTSESDYSSSLWIRLFVEPDAPLPDIRPAPLGRPWFAREMYRCLPLTVGNELGWTIYNPAKFSVEWDGSEAPDGVAGESEGDHVQARFGHGTFSVFPGFYVRTSPGIDLLIKGVPNHPKDGVICLEALLETDWFDGSFLVSMRLTRPHLRVEFAAGEPLFQIVPYPRGWLRRFSATLLTTGPDHAKVLAERETWFQARARRLEPQLRGEVAPDPFDGRYRNNRRTGGEPGTASHETSLEVPAFVHVTDSE